MHPLTITNTEKQPTLSPVPSARFLEQALLFAFVIHGIAMLSMALLLLPGIPGGPNDHAAHIAYIADHPWLWRLGWFPWQLTALADLLIASALLSTKWIPRLPALLALLVTLAAIIPDQSGQLLWITRGIELAQMGHITQYLSFEATVFTWIAAWGGTLYTFAAVGWTWCFIAAGIWKRWLTIYALFLWSLFAFVSISPLLPTPLRPAQSWIAVGNAIGFIGLLAWFVIVTELVLRRSRPHQAHGRYAPWRHPRPRIGRVIDLAANSRFVRSICEYLPVVAFLSDISNVIYINYIVEARRLEPLVPPGLQLQRLGENGRYALFTFLTFKHGHFGPRLLGPLRKLLPSPIQTNWRIHVRDPRTGCQGIYFVTNAVDSTLYALAARMLSEGMPMHVLQKGEIRITEDGDCSLLLDPSSGTAPDARAVLHPVGARPTQGPWSACFDSYQAMLAYCVPQDRALSSQPWYRRMTRQEIQLDIPLDACEPLAGEIHSYTVQAIVGDAVPFCFRVARVHFRLEGETHDRLDL